VVVTGASKGIGFASSMAFAARGAHVVMLARSGERLRQSAAEIGPLALPIVADVGDPDDVRAAFDQIDDAFGRLDVLINNAGSAVLTNIEEATDEQIQLSIGTNLLGPIYTTRAAIPLFTRTGRGDIINVSSESTLNPFPFLGLYAATKAGLETFSRAALAELKPRGIRVTVVVCGTTTTEFGSEWDPEVTLRFLTAAQQSGHLAFAGAGQPMEPSDVADTLVYVATRPPGQILDLLHVRSHHSSDGQDVVDNAVAGAADATEHH